MNPQELTPATKADIARLEGKMDQVIELQTDVRWIKKALFGTYAGLLALFGMKS